MKGTGYGRAGWILLMAVMLLCGGCASTQETATLQQSIGMLYERMQGLERRVDAMEGRTQKSADLYSRQDDLQMKLGAINGRIEELDYKIEQLSRNMATAQQHEPRPASPAQDEGSISFQGSGGQQPPPPPAPAPQPAQNTPAPPPAPVAKVAPPPAPAPTPAPPPPAAAKVPADRAQYDKASQLFQQGQYGQARKEYQIFLDKYPKSDLGDNALFSIGESYYNEKKYQDSIETYQQVRDRFPKGNKVPHAMLKQAAAFEKLGDTTAARILHEQLVEKYPGSPEAQIAEKKLKQ